MVKSSYYFKLFITCITLTGLFAQQVKSQTAGPTAPEFSSFEPVDVTDMVNIASGDLVYTIPLLEVPGPEGGYPLALSYHAGIQPNLEASWVGLGWTLNPGAISRVVNGYPDDFDRSLRHVHDEWEGGETHKFSIGVGIPGTRFGVGLDIAHDTYQGFGVGMNLSVSLGDKGSPVGIGATIGVSPYGQGYLGAGVSVSTMQAKQGAINATVGLGVQTNFKSVSASAGVSVSYDSKTTKQSMYTGSIGGVSASIGSDGLKGNMSVAGSSINQVNSNAGKISSYSNGFSVPIPLYLGGIPLNINIGYNYTRYWSDQISYTIVYGSLYAASSNNDASLATADDRSFDSFSNFDPNSLSKTEADPETEMGGSFPSYDSYTVMGQGLAGSIQPYILENGFLFRQNYKELDINQEMEPTITYHPSSSDARFSKKVNFRFNNDFSNNFFQEDPVSITYSPTLLSFMKDAGSNDLPDGPVDYETIFDGELGGFDPQSNHLAGSKHIEWFTNEEIKNGIAYGRGFVTHDPTYGQRSITVSETSYRPLDNEIIESNETLLDKIANGTTSIGENDYLINVSKQIGGFMITNESGVTYHYSLPVYSYNEYTFTKHKDDINGDTQREQINFQPYAYTWLLTAITGPDYVDDWVIGGGSENYGPSENDYGYWVRFEYGKWSGVYKWRNPANKEYEVDIDEIFRTYSFGQKQLYYLDAIKTRSHTAIFSKKIRADGKGVSTKDDAIYTFGTGSDVPVSTMALDKIFLFKNDVLENYVSTLTNIRVEGEDYNHMIGSDEIHIGDNVVDIDDIAGLPDFTNKALRVIEFDTDYRLMTNTINSFDENGTNYTSPTKTYDKLGKLTLYGITYKGKGGASVLPPTKFYYGTTNPYISPTSYTDLQDADGNLNPSYSVEKLDVWGMYKADYDDYSSVPSENIRHMVTSESAKFLDAWSLSEVETPLGSTIKLYYEPDEYTPPELMDLTVQVKDLEQYDEAGVTPENQDRIKIHSNIFPVDLSTLSPNSVVNLELIFLVNLPNGLSEVVIRFDATVENTINNGNNLWTIVGRNRSLYESDFSYFLYGVMHLPDNFGIKGGGLRVDKISLKAGTTEYITDYSYEKDGVSSGTTSYEPYKLEGPMDCSSDVSDYFKKFLSDRFLKVLASNRFIPAPGVIYESVSVRDFVKHGNDDPVQVPGHKVFHFDVFNYNEDFKREEDNSVDPGIMPGGSYAIKQRTVTLKNYSNRAGNLLSQEVYDGNGNKLQEVINEYAYMGEGGSFDETKYDDMLIDYDDQGVIEQVFHEYREVREKNQFQVILSRLEEYPVIKVAQTTRNYKNNTILTEERTENVAFDFFTGQATHVLSTDAYGNRILAVSDPAYLYYPEMGPIVDASTNKNMLAQLAGNYMYRLDVATDPEDNAAREGLVSASLSTWKKDETVTTIGSATYEGRIWRKYKNYTFIGDDGTEPLDDGTYPYSGYSAFTGWSTHPDSDSPWQLTSTVEKYNNYSKVLEVMDINGNYSSALYSPDNKQIIASAVNARYDEILFTSFEDNQPAKEEIKWDPAIDPPTNKFSHTGTYSYFLESGEYKNIFTASTGKFVATKTYTIDLWGYFPNKAEEEMNDVYIKFIIDGTPSPSYARFSLAKKAGHWYLLHFDFTMPNFSTELTFQLVNYATAGVYFDDFRIKPLGAEMTSYVYDNETGELTYILNNDNLFTHYLYDEAGQLYAISNEVMGRFTEKKIAEQVINYGKNNE